MKKYILYSMLLALSVSSLTSCSEDSLDDHSIIKSSQTEDNAFDKWLTANYINPYNIRFEYRYDDNETDMDYFNVPADYDKAVKLAHIVKYACIEAYDAVGGVAFTRNYFPKLIYTTGEFEYRNNGTMILGTAEGGRKIFLAGTNKLDTYGKTRDGLNEYYLKTIHHEFTHILNQTKDYSPSFQFVTGSSYLADDWSSDEGETGYLTRGFITAYSQYSPTEDFAEMLSTYLTNPQSKWDSWMASAGTTGASLIGQKLEIVRNYMKDSWHIDIDKLRDQILRREDDVVTGKVNLTDLAVK